MKDYKTERVVILKCSLDMGKSIILYRNELVRRSPIEIPDEWPSYSFRGILPCYLEQIENGNGALKTWIAADLLGKRMIGDLMLDEIKGQPNHGYFEMHFIDKEAESAFLRECMLLFLHYIVVQYPKKLKAIFTISHAKETYRNSFLRDCGFHQYEDDGLFLTWKLDITDKEINRE
ncbi:hypothetical protein D0469_04180 [Peribacillus saganii]|uniref:N-acetyltransferase n=1 Tax=Peribacillus saganii TaxID=2303992 RepID=A0A372LSI4_9BACI|nr:hypothetical protein [Peribacillus saganii]RFU71143.1 hypothetical protein D0469_04180 [Peribacillus saganii]